MADYFNSHNKKFWGDAGAGVLIYCKTTNRYLLNYRSKYVNEPNTYGVWGGKLDRGETNPKMSALREFKEETGNVYNKPIIMNLLCVYKTEGFIYHNYIGYIEEEFTPNVENCWESDGYIWTELNDFEKLNLHFGVEYILKTCKDKLLQL